LSLQQEWYENGQQRYEKNYKDRELHGLETNWHENGQIWLKKTYKNGVENGPAASWYKDGQRKAEETYKEGDIVAPSIYWDESGTKRKDIVNDTGTWLLETNWNASGQKESQYTLDNGKRNGLLPFTTVTGRKKPRTFLAMVRTCSVRANSGMSLENLRRARHTLEFLAKIRWIDSRGC
jgi:antitoxin component YwqK of YwqJK toxin-antitoxin module